MKTKEQVQYVIDIEDEFCTLEFSRKLGELIESVDKNFEQITFVCIGTDRSTGDSFGPLVGHMISRYTHKYKVHGTLKHPVHAKNLDIVLSGINYDKELVIAIDASLGAYKHIGNIVLSNKPIKPGIGVGKDCALVGDISIVGIVNMAGFAPNLLLQCTRLYLVHRMASIVNMGINSYFYKHRLKNKTNSN